MAAPRRDKALKARVGLHLTLTREKLELMGMSAIFTAVPPASLDELAVLARTNESRVHKPHRRTFGRRAVAELVVALAPASHVAFALAVLESDAWGFLTPVASRGNHAIALREVHADIALPSPLWPESTEFACLVGVPQAHYIGNNLAMIPPELVRAGVAVFEPLEAYSDAATYFNEFLRACDRGDAVLLHSDFR